MKSFILASVAALALAAPVSAAFAQAAQKNVHRVVPRSMHRRAVTRTGRSSAEDTGNQNSIGALPAGAPKQQPGEKSSGKAE